MIKRIFITGLTATVALTITGYVIVGLFYFADGFLGKPINAFVYKYLGQTIPGLGIVIGILIIFILGLLIQISRMRFFRWAYHWAANLFLKIPLVSKIYFPVKRIVDFLFFPPKKDFKSAVLVEYPRKGLYSLGFITNENNIEFSGRGKSKLYNVFIPSSPSPLTGFTIIVEEREVNFLNVSVEEALRLVVSGGLLNPQ
ncbi:MAG: DUF502 domain-containing protein [Candidatus Omnitrophica bacterium]|nr:DUF502 domain-containing protein [Candidatus Omnitrophota bacterium]MBU2044648.1 DUF502 domain-containing protein [Candidatus Omnitrophota bacterium]MBU2251659.1 DUF502 domain-containing protein [Candidatus Omnitrophota bacterium]MBU2473577.1 DUF502 domain-containing protein [Candidatus Omnitrophota bacterium]